ncbi:hypothetical protein JTE90_021340 [Oedothorax gibbosus]|uniref:PIPK domain-containing protein n=1 Tax=Oedothorax gibbosus TaxID=931172 RepID=A0AAV6TXM5_9ARAC|nr:hypothetical protein JTE90_021340 [Oedothorax gibbosus]
MLNKSIKRLRNIRKRKTSLKEDKASLLERIVMDDGDCKSILEGNFSDSKEIVEGNNFITKQNEKTTQSGNIFKSQDKLALPIEHLEPKSIESKVLYIDIEEEIDLDLVQLGIKLSLEDVSKMPFNNKLIDAKINKTVKNPKFEKLDFKFIAHSPIAFHIFRESFGIHTHDLMRSVCDNPFLQIPSYDKRYSKAFTTMDGQYMFRMCSKEEAFFLKCIFQGYFLNFTHHIESLLPKYFGLFSYTRTTKEVWMLLMNNYLPTCINFQDLYFIKGSINSERRSGKKDGQYESYVAVSGNKPLKDLDFLENCPDGYFLSEETHKRLMKTISRDCKMLESFGITNYSLVLCACSPSRLTKIQRNEGQQAIPVVEQVISKALDGNPIGIDVAQPYAALSSKGEKVYLFLSFANILHNYDFIRKFESLTHGGKSKSYVYENTTVPVISTDIYSSRFQSFLKNSVLKCLHITFPLN